MTEQKAGPRPPQVTVAAGVAAAGSALLVVTLFDSMSTLHSVEVRQGIAQALAQSGHPWGLGVAEATRVIRNLMLVAGAAAAAATVLAGYALFRHRAARIGLTVAAAVLVLTVVSGVFGLLVAAATAMLWSRPARDWFAGRAPAPVPAGAAASSRQPLLSSAEEGPRSEQEPPADQDEPRPVPPPTYGFGTPHAHRGPPPSYPGPAPQRYPAPTGQGNPQQAYPGTEQPTQPYQVQQPYPPSSAWPPPSAYPPPGAWPPPTYGQRPTGPVGRRPTTVTIAAVLTWLFSAIAFVGFLAAVVVLLGDRSQMLDVLSNNPQVASSGLTSNQLIAVIWVVCAIFVFWCVVSMVLAFLAFRGHNWARITLVVSAAVAALFGAFAFPTGLAHAIVAAAVIVLLFTGGANDWFARRSRPSYPPAYYPPQHPQGYGAPPQHPQEYGGPPQRDEKDPPSNVW